MFPSRYFPGRMFTARYFPQSQGNPPVVVLGGFTLLDGLTDLTEIT